MFKRVVRERRGEEKEGKVEMGRQRGGGGKKLEIFRVRISKEWEARRAGKGRKVLDERGGEDV